MQRFAIIVKPSSLRGKFLPHCRNSNWLILLGFCGNAEAGANYNKAGSGSARVFVAPCFKAFQTVALVAPRGAGDAYQSPSKFGLRFSRNADMPSFWAAVPKPAWK